MVASCRRSASAQSGLVVLLPGCPRHRVLLATLALLAVVLPPIAAWAQAGAPAAAQAAQDDDACARATAAAAEHEARVAACSRVIASNRFAGARASWLYNNRGVAY